MMKSLVITLISVMLSLWVVAIAILSIQNVFILTETGEQTLVSLTFLGQSSIAMPLGVILATSAALGMVATAIALIPLSRPKSSGRDRLRQTRNQTRSR